ncbi:TLD family protein [Tritrichomonas foetus]|uniref:Oxidation resistance protein 1 n=1 Tax=Tritrichomonas foetus TaxID=1144522 RepID=A0A1J4JNV0_9EUKA|nr:TLD family protein [Tritrichomonas foetus]|eukprot:OHT00402.1 TLD family protein [Tritrichomonas foetus]
MKLWRTFYISIIKFVEIIFVMINENKELFIEEEEEETDSIIGVLSVDKQDFPGRIFLTEDNQIIIRLDFPSTENTQRTVINPIGLLETNVVPHPSTLDFGPEVDIEDDGMPASLLITYLQNLFDNSSYKTLCFNAIRGQLVEFNKKIDAVSSNLKARLLFEGPNLTPNINGGTRRKTRRSDTSTVQFQLKNGPSGILNESQIDTIRLALPLRFKHLSWTKIYDMRKDGVSLSTLYSKAKNCMPLIIFVETSQSVKIGAFLSCGLKIVRGYSGSGETFVFRFNPDVEVFKWSKNNDLFVSASQTDIAIGGGGGNAIYLNSALEKGVSEYCETFASPPLANSPTFNVINVELWHIKSEFAK